MTLFARDEFDLGSDETLDMENRLGRKLYWGESKYFNMYNTKETVGIKGELGNMGVKIIQHDTTKEVYQVKPREIWAALADQIKKKYFR